jgi:hypothetical protein
MMNKLVVTAGVPVLGRRMRDVVILPQPESLAHAVHIAFRKLMLRQLQKSMIQRKSASKRELPTG